MMQLEAMAGVAKGGTLYGIGVGPGDIRLITLRAAGVILSVDVLVYFAKKGSQGHARQIIGGLVAPGRAEMKLDYPLTDEVPVDDPEYQSQIREFYAGATAAISQRLSQGQSVGVLAAGDPFFYGSFMHLWRRLKDDFPIEVVPGVSGMSGCWSRAGAPITWGDDILTVLSGTLEERVLTGRLRDTDAAVIMKVGRNLGKVRRAVLAADCMARAIYVERSTTAAEVIQPLEKCTGEIGPYFSMVIVPGQGRRL